jgi:hypothetical protein
MTHVHILSTRKNKEIFMNSHLASERLRLSYFAEAAESMGLKVTVGPSIPASTEIVFLGKLTSAFGSKIVNQFLNELALCEAKVIIDYTDDWLADITATSEIYRQLVSMSDIVTIPTIGLSKQTRTLQRQYFVVPDGLDQIEPIAPRLHNNNIKEVLWFGHPTNLESLISYLDGNFGLNKFKMNILSDPKSFNFLSHYKFKPNRGFEIILFKWSFDNLIKLGNFCDLKILPVNKPFASANRLLTAFNLGLPVISSSIECYRPFSEFYAELGTRDATELFKNPSQWNEKILKVQEKIQLKYNKENIISKWKKLFSKLNSSPFH